MSATRVRSSFLSFQPPSIGEQEVEAVAATLRSGWLTSGPVALELERRFAELTGAAHAIAVSSGTAAMHLALVAAGIGPGDEVITSPITWPATANVIVHAGATPVFCDVRPGDLTLDPEQLAAVSSERTRAVLPVDLAGQPCDYDAILPLARAYGWVVIEDAAHAVAAFSRGRRVGSFADATCFSLYATKNVAAGEGGIVTTNDAALAGRIDELRLMRRQPGALYDVAVAGYKANLPDVLAAIALCQLDRLDGHAAIRARHVELYDQGLAGLPGIAPLARDAADVHANHLYVVRIDPERAGATRDDYQCALAEELIGTSIHFLPVHTLTYYRERFPVPESLPVAERAGREVLSLPLSPAHSDADVLDAVDAVRRVHGRFAA